MHASALGISLEKLMTNYSHVISLRTGHLGNWQEIKCGRAGAVDHNGSVVKKNWAAPFYSRCSADRKSRYELRL